MSSLALRGHEFYVKVGDDTAALERLRAVVGADCSVVRGPGSAYCVVLWADETFDPPEQLLATLSRDLSTEVIWLAWQKQVDAFAFQRWVGGNVVRRLAYGIMEKERTWELVEGTSEPWEVEAFFSSKRLERELQVRTLFPGNDDVTEQELRRVW